MTRETRAGLGLAAGCALLASTVGWSVHGLAAGLVMLAILGPVGVVTVLGLQALLARRDRLGGLRRQLALVGTIALGQLLVCVGLLVGVMFISTDAALLTALAAIYAGLFAAWAARALGHRMLADVDEVRRGLGEIADGGRQVSLRVTGGDEMAALAGDVERMAARLDVEEQARSSAERAHRDLLAAVSHDLRTPITSLRLLADALQDGIVEEDARREYVARMGIHVRALGSLIEDLFELSRLQAGEIRWTMDQVPLNELVLETVEAMRPHADARSVAVQAELDSSLAAARANPEQIQRVLFNLIQNAIRHTPADGSVTVRAQAAGDALEIEVADTGTGIAAEDRGRVFEPFFQGGERASRSDAGAGLGLAISRAIVEAHGGRIWLAAGAGTRVRFSLPRAISAGAGAL